MRPTGRLHIGHLFGALANWIEMQSTYDCFFFVADWHALTSHYATRSEIAQNSVEIATDWLASGLDPAKCTMFLQSQVPEHAELQLLLSMVTPLGWLERVPTYKEALENAKGKDLHTLGFLGYPVLQTADIVMYGEVGTPLAVPVGEDQVAHIELSRELVRRFNSHFGFHMSPKIYNAENLKLLNAILHKVWKFDLEPNKTSPQAQDHSDIDLVLPRYVRDIGFDNFLAEFPFASTFMRQDDVLPLPMEILTTTPRIPGTDGRKMSKSYNNFIALSEDNDSVYNKIRYMITDPQRTLRTIPGNPDVCPVFDWHKLFSAPEVIQSVDRDCRTAAIGCVDCKNMMAKALIKQIEPVRERRRTLETKPAAVLDILGEGSKKARAVARATMERVREAIFGWGELRESIASNASKVGS
jgi:tryptophanyl-tRNA synthetase